MTQSVPVAGRFRLRVARPSARGVLAAVLVALIFLVASTGPLLSTVLLAMIILVCFVWLSSRWPQFSIAGLVVWVPLQIAVLAFLYKHGAPASLVKYLGYLKEFWAISLVVAALRSTARTRKLDLLDWAVVLFVGSATVYLLLPLVAPTAMGGVPFWARLTAWRTDVLFFIIFFSARRLTFSPRALRAFRNCLFFVAIVLAGFAIWESSDSAGFTTFIGKTLGYPAYKAQILGVIVKGPILVYGSGGSGSFVRAGSLLNDPASLGFLMLIPLAVGLQRFGARRLSIAGAVVAGMGLTTLMLTATRGVIIAGAIVVLLAIVLGRAGAASARIRIILVMLAAAVLLLPTIASSNAATRFKETFNPQDIGSQQHVTRTRAAITAIIDQPEGRGLGASSAIGARYDTSTALTAEDSYLETGNELGVPAMAFFVIALLAALGQLRKRSRTRSEFATLAGSLWLAGWGLLIGGFFLQDWYLIAVTLPFWALTGVALSGPDDDATEADDNVVSVAEGLRWQPHTTPSLAANS